MEVRGVLDPITWQDYEANAGQFETKDFSIQVESIRSSLDTAVGPLI